MQATKFKVRCHCCPGKATQLSPTVDPRVSVGERAPEDLSGKRALVSLLEGAPASCSLSGQMTVLAEEPPWARPTSTPGALHSPLFGWLFLQILISHLLFPACSTPGSRSLIWLFIKCPTWSLPIVLILDCLDTQG